MTLTATYTRRRLAELIRTPVMFLSLSLVPVAVMLFFIVPYVGADPPAMTAATATLIVFAILLACVGHFSTVVAYERESDWGSYLKTLPVGLGPQVTSHLLTGLIVVIAGLVPVVIVAIFLTSATASLGQILLTVVVLPLPVVTFTLLGLALGYLLSLRWVIIVNSVAFLPLAVGGGMFFDPDEMPPIVEAVAPYIPTRGAADVVLATLAGVQPSLLALVMLAVWTALFAVLTVYGFRRDERRRFT